MITGEIGIGSEKFDGSMYGTTKGLVINIVPVDPECGEEDYKQFFSNAVEVFFSFRERGEI